ncbi:hypothetical protein ACHAWF_011035 [Thalassiosira exigua]
MKKTKFKLVPRGGDSGPRGGGPRGGGVGGSGGGGAGDSSGKDSQARSSTTGTGTSPFPPKDGDGESSGDPPQQSGEASGSKKTPGGFAAYTEEEGSFAPGSSFDWDGKDAGASYASVTANAQSSGYLPSPSASNVSFVQPPSTPAPLASPARSIRLPKAVLKLFSDAGCSSIPTVPHPSDACFTWVVGDTGATNHMFPDKSAFISYRTVHGIRVRVGNNSFAPVAGRGSAIISLNGKKVLVRDALHVPDLRNPLYSLRAHQKQRGCGFFGACDQGIYVYFPGFVLEVDTSSDCLLSYCPIGRAARHPDLDYVQPKPLVESQTSGAASSATSSPAASAQLPAVSQSQDKASAPDQLDKGLDDDDLDDLAGEFHEFACHSP